MIWSADEIRQLRYRLGWSQAEMARHLNLELGFVSSLESGREAATDEMRNSLIRIFQQAEVNADKVQRRPIAEVMMKDRGLSQIHDVDVVDSIELAHDADPTNTRGQA